MSDDVVLGKFGRPHGVKGEVRFFRYNPESDLLAPELELRLADSEEKVTVTSVRSGQKFVIVALEGVQDREGAERLRNKEAFVPRSSLPEPDAGEFYLVDVVGFEVWGATTAGEERRLFGTVKGWLDVNATDIMAVTGPNIRGRMLVPHLDHVVDEIDFGAGRVNLHPLENWAPVDA